MKLPIFLTCFFFSVSLSAQYKYPVTRTVDSSDTYFGVTYKDPYRWLEYIEQPEVESWFKQQATYADSILNKLPGRDSLIAEWKRLDKLQPPHIGWNRYENGRYFYKKTLPGENVGKLYYREGINGTEQLLFDPSAYMPGKTLSIQMLQPSHDGKKLAFSYAEQGSEVSTVRIMDVDTKQLLQDSLALNVGIGSWTFDNQSFFYEQIKSADNKDPSARLNPKAKRHVLGTDAAADADFFSSESYPDMHMDSSAYPFVFLDEDAKDYIFSGEGTVQSEMKINFAPASEANAAHINWQTLCTPANQLVRGIVVRGNDVYAITYQNAKNYKVVKTTLPHPNWEHAETVAPEKPGQTVEYFANSKDYLFIVYSDGINNHVSKYNFTTKATTEVTLPYSGTVGLYCPNPKTNDCLLGITSWTKPYVEFSYNAKTDAFGESPFNKPSVYPDAYKNLQVEEVEVKGHDGTMIPMSIIYQKGTKLDGSNTCLMDAYGAYGYSMTPYFDMMENSLATRGVVVAYPHVRGGGEKGEDWYRAGFKTTKPNTWKDFISCAEYLISKGYTSPSKLAGTGTSAGGVMISRAITERPDLFAAAICNVGCANAMRLEFSTNGPVNIPEFGTVKDSAECKALYEMDGMQHVANGTKYPALISVAGWNDPRVVPWEPGKFAAAVQNASQSGKPVLLKINYDNGHFTEDKSVTFHNFADQYAFAMWQAGHPLFQPK